MPPAGPASPQPPHRTEPQPTGHRTEPQPTGPPDRTATGPPEGGATRPSGDPHLTVSVRQDHRLLSDQSDAAETAPPDRFQASDFVRENRALAHIP
ncbi:hypothetical protein GCM10009827_048370 [Dactylosporangium maewongense]|uniref:Uncharacterized protein n=1 Tax=Dactylosporangium maewongense TaxID=634393 RepID=A0ABP4LKB7_9ACTN